MEQPIWLIILQIFIPPILTLGGVLIGVSIQNRNINRQRQWSLDDQKREWIRNKINDDFRCVLAHLEGTLEILLKIDIIINSPKKNEELILKSKEQIAAAMPTIYLIMNNDEKLKQLFMDFEREKNIAFDAFAAQDKNELDTASRKIAEICGEIHAYENHLIGNTYYI